MVNWRNFTFEYYWHALAAFGMNRGRMSSRNQTTDARHLGRATGFLTRVFAAKTVFIEWAYMNLSEAPQSSGGLKVMFFYCAGFTSARKLRATSPLTNRTTNTIKGS
jgi:hypothetical protein